VAELLRQPRSLGTGFELGLVNLQSLKPRQVYQVLHHHEIDLKQRIDAVDNAWRNHQTENGGASEHIAALYTHSLAMMRAELEWLSAFLDMWRTKYPGVDKPDTGEIEVVDPHKMITRMNTRTQQSDPAKMIQRLKRISRPEEE
jgi:hypothetical protein